jgi:hypothetical protein
VAILRYACVITVSSCVCHGRYLSNLGWECKTVLRHFSGWYYERAKGQKTTSTPVAPAAIGCPHLRTRGRQDKTSCEVEHLLKYSQCRNKYNMHLQALQLCRRP